MSSILLSSYPVDETVIEVNENETAVHMSKKAADTKCTCEQEGGECSWKIVCGMQLRNLNTYDEAYQQRTIELDAAKNEIKQLRERLAESEQLRESDLAKYTSDLAHVERQRVSAMAEFNSMYSELLDTNAQLQAEARKLQRSKDDLRETNAGLARQVLRLKEHVKALKQMRENGDLGD